jgi:hypothetical protein
VEGTFVGAGKGNQSPGKDQFARYFERIAFQAADVRRSITGDPKLPAIDGQVVQIDLR